MGFVVPLTRQQISDVYASGERPTIRLIEDLYSTIVDFENNYDRYLQQQSQAVHATNARLNIQITKLKERNYELFRLNYEREAKNRRLGKCEC